FKQEQVHKRLSFFRYSSQAQHHHNKKRKGTAFLLHTFPSFESCFTTFFPLTTRRFPRGLRLAVCYPCTSELGFPRMPSVESRISPPWCLVARSSPTPSPV